MHGSRLRFGHDFFSSNLLSKRFYIFQRFLFRLAHDRVLITFRSRLFKDGFEYTGTSKLKKIKWCWWVNWRYSLTVCYNVVSRHCQSGPIPVLALRPICFWKRIMNRNTGCRTTMWFIRHRNPVKRGDRPWVCVINIRREHDWLRRLNM